MPPSSSTAVRSSGSLTQLVTVGKPAGGLSQGTTLFMLTNNNGSNTLTPVNTQALNAVLARAKVTTTPTIGRPKVVNLSAGGTIRPLVSTAAGSTIFLDARKGQLKVSESHQTKADRIVAEAIAKAQAEGLNIEVSTDSTDPKKRRRKKGDEDADEGMPPKKKRPPRPKVPGRKGLKDDAAEGMIVDAAADGMAVSEECEVLTSDDIPEVVIRQYGKVNKIIPIKNRKKRPLSKFLKRKKKRRGESDSDLSDIDTPSGSIIDEDSLQFLQTRRSGRAIRKKYVDEPDIELSDEDHSPGRDEDSTMTADSSNLVNGIGDMVGQPSDPYQDAPAEEDSQIVDKVLAVRTVKKKVICQKIEKVDDGDDVDVEGGEDRKDVMDRKSVSERVEEVDVEEYFVKYKNFSYMHCEWRTADELLLGDKRVLSKIKRFKIKKASSPLYVEADEDEPFNPDYVEVERVLDVSVTPDQVTGEMVTHYLVSWRSLPYEDSTWELEQDVEQSKIDAFNRYRKFPPPEEREFRARPLPKDWVSLPKTQIYKNDNVLRDYQLEGLNWLTFCYYNRQNCILADEMGLGKTIQSISFLKEVFDYGIRGPFLIVVPLSTIGNWQREFEAWTDMNAIVYHGTMASRNMLRQYEMYYRDERGYKLGGIYKFHALVTTYEVIISDLEELSAIDWRVAIIDEAHRLKNRNCKLLQGLSCFELEHRVLLTGTPLQNNVDELFSLLSFLEPRQFSSSEAFNAEFGRLETESQVDKLKALLKPMMLRRLKEDVEKTLASKEETIIEVELTNIQKKYYRAILERNFSFLAKGSTSSNLPNLMNTMMELRKCCNHPYLINGAEEQILEEAKVGTGGQALGADKLFHWLVQSSGKLVLVDKLLPKLRSDGHKVLIFSQMIRVLDLIEDYLLQRQYPYERIDGRIRGNLRQEAIDRFSKPDSDRFIFLLCTRAGGLGINLTAADTVIIFDSDWNPQNDLQAQARCHRIGQLKAVKVYRLITRNTYEREMFDRASLKLGLDKAVLQSAGQKDLNAQQTQLSKKEIEDLLKKGAYGALMDDDTAGEQFCEEDIDHILQRRTQVIQIEAGIKGSTFAKASFNLSTNRSDINIDDPNFWQKWAKKADIDVNGAKNDLIMELPRERKKTARYGKQDMINMSELDTSNSDEEDEAKNGKKRKKRRAARDEDRTNFTYTRAECFKVEKNLLVYGWGRWTDIHQHSCFKRKIRIDDVIKIARAMLLFSLKHYEGDERIKKFIFDLISPSEDGKEKDYRNHSGLSAPVPRGRKGRKGKGGKESGHKSQFDEDLTKLDIDVDSVLVDDSYKKHLIRQANKVLLRVRLLYYLKQEVIGRQAEKIFDGAPASEIDVPLICADVDIPVYWWDAEADKCLLVGVFKHGYEKFNLMRQDPCLCFLSRCGPPDCKALLAEQNDEDDIKEEEVEQEVEEMDEDLEESTQDTTQDIQEATPRQRGRRKKKKRASRHKKDKEKPEKEVKPKDVDKDHDNDLDADDASPHQPAHQPTKYDGPTEDGKLPFPTPSDLNTRFRRIITSFQRSHKQGMLKLEQISKKMHKREQRMERDPAAGSDVEDYGPPPSPSRLPSLGLDGVGSNPLLLAEQLHWTRREEADFYRVVSTFGVERDCETGQFIWDKFRVLAHLERKLDNTLTEYFRAFYHMCLKVCRRFTSEEEARPPNGLYVLAITEERANRCLARIDLLNKIREQILWHPWLDNRLALCQPSSYLPQWWICGQHDKDLLIGAAKHGVSHTETNILTDPLLSFHVAYQAYQEHMKDTLAAQAAEQQRTASPRLTAEAGAQLPNGDVTDSNSTSTSAATDSVKTEPNLEGTPPEKPKTEPGAADPDQKPNAVIRVFPSDILKLESKMETGEVNGGTDETLMMKAEEVMMKEEDEQLDSEEAKALAYSWNYQWPKDRIIFYRLEHICHCIETGRWRMSHRHNISMNDSATPSTSVPGTPVGSGQDYTIGPDDIEGLKMTLHKRRHRRTKAEMEAGRGRIAEDGTFIPGDDSSTGELRAGNLEGGETPPLYARKKQYRVRRPKMGDDLFVDRTSDPDAHIPVVSKEGQILTGDEAPMLRDLDTWLDDHPGFAPLSEVMGNQKPIQRRRPRLDPTKLAVEQLTGNENVTVVNRNTGKRITGIKAPVLRELAEWLLRNPGFDVDSKWANIVFSTINLPDELRPRILSPSSDRIRHAASNIDPTASASSHEFRHSILTTADLDDDVVTSFKMPDCSGGGPKIPLTVDPRWGDMMPDDSRDEDDDSEDGYSDHESSSSSIPRHVSHLLAGPSASMFHPSHPYLCNPNVVDRLCANIGGSATNLLPSDSEHYLSGRDRFVADARMGGNNVLATSVAPQRYAMPHVDNEVDLHSYSRVISGSGLQPALFDGPSDDEAYPEESQSPAGEEMWQYVEEGEVELG